MCHTRSTSEAMQSKRVQFLAPASVQSAMASPSAPSMQKKLINQLRPFRKVARSARINLNRYWGLLSQRYAVSTKPATPTTAELEEQYATEMEQNRINEMLEAQACAISQNSLNSLYEEQYSLGTRSRSSVASSVSNSACRYPCCDCGLLMPAPMAPAPQHQRFASLSSSAYSSFTSPAPSCTSSTAELYFFNNSPRKFIEEVEFDVGSQYSMIL